MTKQQVEVSMSVGKEKQYAKNPLSEFFTNEENFTRKMKFIANFYTKIENDPQISGDIKKALKLCSQFDRSPWQRPQDEQTQKLYDAVTAGFNDPGYNAYMQKLVEAVDAVDLVVNYAKSHPKEMAYVNEQFTKHRADASQGMQSFDATDLSSYMVEPYQRIPRYEMPLKEVAERQAKYSKLLAELDVLSKEVKQLESEAGQSSSAEKAEALAAKQKLLAEKNVKVAEAQKDLVEGSEHIAESMKKASHHGNLANQRQGANAAYQTLAKGWGPAAITSAAKLFDIDNITTEGHIKSKLAELPNNTNDRTEKEDKLFDLYSTIRAQQDAVDYLGTEKIRELYNKQSEQSPKAASTLLAILAISHKIPAADRIDAYIDLSKSFQQGKISSHDKADYAAKMLRHAKEIYNQAEKTPDMIQKGKELDRAIIELHQHCIDHKKNVSNLPMPISGEPVPVAVKKSQGSELLFFAKDALYKLKNAVAEVTSSLATTPKAPEAPAAKPEQKPQPDEQRTRTTHTQQEMKEKVAAGRNEQFLMFARDQHAVPSFDSVHVGRNKSYASFKLETDGSSDKFMDFCDDHDINYDAVQSPRSTRVQITVSGNEFKKLVKAFEHSLSQDQSPFIDTDSPSMSKR